MSAYRVVCTRTGRTLATGGIVAMSYHAATCGFDVVVLKVR